MYADENLLFCASGQAKKERNDGDNLHNGMGLWLGSGRGVSLLDAREALRLGLTGYARNLDDGSVEVLACGEEDQVAALIARLKPAGRAVRGLTESIPSLINPPESGKICHPLLNALHRFRQAGNFGGLFGWPFREQTVEIAAVAFLFAKLIRHRLH